MKKILYISIVAMILISGCHSSKDSSFRPDYDFSNINQVAIVSIEGAVQSQAAKNQIADFFMLELLKKGYAPMERSQVKAILNQQELESATLNSPEGAIEVGNILNVPAVVMINIPHFGENITMTAKMIDVETGGQILAATDDCTGCEIDELLTNYDGRRAYEHPRSGCPFRAGPGAAQDRYV